jgi:hypothetical protein
MTGCVVVGGDGENDSAAPERLIMTRMGEGLERDLTLRRMMEREVWVIHGRRPTAF